MAESPQIEQIIVEFFSKVAQTILESRILSFSRATSSSASSSSASSSFSSSPPKVKDKWFNLNLGLSDNIMFPSIEPWNRTPTQEPMFVDILLSDVASTSRPIGQGCRSLLLERWAVHYALDSSFLKSTGVERPVVYKKGVILLRSLYSTARLLPAYRIYRELKKSPCNSRRICYRISSMSEPLQIGRMKVYNFTPVETQCGKLCLSVHYLPATVDRGDNLGFDRSVSSIGAQIIPDYCGGNAFDKRFQVTSRGKSDVSSAPNSPGCKTVGIGRCHSWSGGINKILTRQTSLQRIGMNPMSANPHHHVPMLNFGTPPLPMPIQQKRQSNAESFQSLSPSPPIRSRLSNASKSSGLLRTGSTPAIISSSSVVSSPQNVSGEYFVQSKNPLLYHSNKGRKPHVMSRAASTNSMLIDTYAPASSGSPPLSGKFVVSRTSDVQANMQAHTGYKEEKDQSGSPSGLKFLRSGSSAYTVSRSSSKNSYNYEVEDEDRSCPFALDDDESDGNKSRAESLDGKGIMPEVMEACGQTLSTPRRSQNAAVGALVEMLKSAPSLQQNVEKSSEFLRSDSWMEASQGQNIAKEYEATRSSAEDFTSKKNTTAEALRQLKDYKEIKDSLLRQRGIPERKMP